MKKIITGLLLSASLLAGCSKDNNENEQGSLRTVAGTVQKGPFVTGTSIKVQLLDNELNPTGSSMETQITDDFGRFTVSGKVEGDYAEIIGTGYYFNEVTNVLSSSPIVLRSLTDIQDTGTANLNILTTLQAPRVRKLVGEGKSFTAAVAQSQAEILAAFGITLNNCPAFATLNIAEQGQGNAVLLAISAIMQIGRSEAELSEFIAKVANDIADNGALDSSELAEAIKQGHMAVDADEVRNNLIARYAVLGQPNVSVPDFTDYLDSDGNGELNMNETDLDFRLSIVWDGGNSTRAAGGNNTADLEGSPCDNLTDITVLIFDEQGRKVFVRRDNAPQIEDDNYNFSFTAQNGEKVFDNSTIYVLLNSPKDYSGYTGTESGLADDDITINQGYDYRTGIKIGKVSAKLTTAKENTINVPVQIPVAKIHVEVAFDETVPAAERILNSVMLTGAFTQGAVFNVEKNDSPTGNIALVKNEDAYECWAFGNSPLKLLIMTVGGTYEVSLRSHTGGATTVAGQNLVYECKIAISPSLPAQSEAYVTIRPIYAPQVSPEL